MTKNSKHLEKANYGILEHIVLGVLVTLIMTIRAVLRVADSIFAKLEETSSVLVSNMFRTPSKILWQSKALLSRRDLFSAWQLWPR